jgi:hypothetical protein
MGNFKNDLKFGQTYEGMLTTLIKNDGYTTCNNKDYDLALIENGETIYYEVKSDRLTSTTGNICIEFECYNKPSGITTTKANRYAYYEIKPDGKYTLYIIPVRKIRKKIEQQKYKRIYAGGDNKASRFYLFDKTIFNKYVFHSE